jgi:hypothetical protein
MIIERRSLFQQLLTIGLIMVSKRLSAAEPNTAGIPPELSDYKELIASYAALDLDINSVYRVFSNVQQALKSEDAELFASQCLLPLKFIEPRSRSQYLIESRTDIQIKIAPLIFSPDVRYLLEEQKFTDLFVNADGAMLGRGQLWIEPKCLDRKCSEAKYGIGIVNPQPLPNPA